jgi:branched-chain amino acid aminotransferase
MIKKSTEKVNAGREKRLDFSSDILIISKDRERCFLNHPKTNVREWGIMSQQDSVCYINGEFKTLKDAKISATDLAIMRGFGVFDSLRTYGGKLFGVEDHLTRLERSAKLVSLPLPWTREELHRTILETLSRNSYDESSVRIIITGGYSDDFFTPAGKPGLIVIVRPLPRYPDEYYTKGVKIATASLERFLPEAKTLNYTSGEVAMREAKNRDPEIFEVLCLDRNGKATECIASNVFVFFDETLTTPGADILYGITRQVVLKLARPLFPVDVRDVQIDEIKNADEVFITGSSKEIMPVRSIDNRVIGQGRCGPNTRKLMDAFREMTDRFKNTGTTD